MLAIIGGLALAGGIACGITLGVLGAPGLVIATAIGVTLGTILLGASIALLPSKMKKILGGK
ncbi:putative membrane protein [Chlamydia psittaci VS225]|nr:putative membrane protein [Chlamydia psittaci VS225]